MSVDHEELAESLAALAYPARLELLEQLHFPRTLSELRVRARRGDPDLEGDRVSSKQAVQGHLAKLRDAGLVTMGDAEAFGRILQTYAVDPQRLYAVVEALRSIGARHAGRGRSADVTGTLAEAPSATFATGPRVVVVHGLYEGHAYPLAAEGPWTIGRARSCDVALDYDPFVSARNALLERTAFGFRLRDADESKNGTRVNWRPLPPGGATEVRHGDVLGFGKSLLVFYDR